VKRALAWLALSPIIAGLVAGFIYTLPLSIVPVATVVLFYISWTGFSWLEKNGPFKDRK
jgi:hypothetical protein